MKISNIFKHTALVLRHKSAVMRNCAKCGLLWRGIKHDLSKFTPTEFFESVKYYQGTSSPIDACKKVNGWSKAWLHHKGRNDHHYEYWQDNFDKGGEALLMPKECAIELVCDYLGAGRAYMGKNFTYEKEYKWWADKKSNPLAMHPKIKEFIECVMQLCWADQNVGHEPNLKMLNDMYDIIVLNQ